MADGWRKLSDRHYIGSFNGMAARLVCADTKAIPEQHDKWLLISECDDNSPVVGVWGDEMSIVFDEARFRMASFLRGVLNALSADGSHVV